MGPPRTFCVHHHPQPSQPRLPKRPSIFLFKRRELHRSDLPPRALHCLWWWPPSYPRLQGRAENAAIPKGCCFGLRFPSALSQRRESPSETAEKTCAQARPRPLPEAGRVAGSDGSFSPGPGRRAASGLRPLAGVRLRKREHGVFFGREHTRPPFFRGEMVTPTSHPPDRLVGRIS